jgi:hypothetical protein
MPTQDHLSNELDAFRRQFGSDKEHTVRRAFATIVHWLRQSGHGDVKLSAKDHGLSPKVRFDTVVDSDGSGP